MTGPQDLTQTKSDRQNNTAQPSLLLKQFCQSDQFTPLKLNKLADLQRTRWQPWEKAQIAQVISDISKLIVSQDEKKGTTTIQFLNQQIVTNSSLSDLSFLLAELFLYEPYYFDTSNEKPLIIDAGANIGIGLLYHKYRHPKAKIIAFEPVREVCQIAQKNISANRLKDIKLVNAALAGSQGQMTIFQTQNNMSSTLTQRLQDWGVPLDLIHQSVVKTVPLSSYVKNQKVDLLKMDIEGMEEQVITELHQSNVLSNIDRIFIEYHYNNTDKNTNQLEVIIDILRQEGFTYTMTGTLGDHLSRNYRPFTQYQKPWACNLYAQKGDYAQK